MNTRQVEVLHGEYHDSVTLMSASLALGNLSGVAEAQVAMGTPLNLGLLAERGFKVRGAGRNDLVLAVRAVDLPGVLPEAVLAFAKERLTQVLAARAPASAVGGEPTPHTTAGVLAGSPAELALVSVPGEHAFVEAMDALRAGTNVMVFSDNMPVEQEVALKQEAAHRGLLVMGPDCGTAIIDAAGLGFASTPEAGRVSIVAASGTGAQQLTCLFQVPGMGIYHVLGVGGRDLTAEVGGLSTMAALDALQLDGDNELTIVVSKPPDEEVLRRLQERTMARRQPVLWAPVGPGHDDLTTVAEKVLRRVGWPVPEWPRWQPVAPLEPRPGLAVSGLFCGGTLCAEASAILGASLPPERYAMTDFGDDRYTRGRAHPMIDPTMRNAALERAAADPALGVVLLDVVLGNCSHPDPAVDLVPLIERTQANVVVSLIGMRGDQQDLDRQGRTLAMAGAHVHMSNAAAARHALYLVS